MHILFCLHDFFYKCKPFKVINPVIICRGDWIRHLVALEEGGGGTEYWLSSANELTAESQSWGEWAAQCTVFQGSPKNLDNSDVKLRFMYQNWPSKSHQLPFDQGIQIVIPPRSPASVPEPIGTPSDCILHWSEWPGFAVYYVNGLDNSAPADLSRESVLW